MRRGESTCIFSTFAFSSLGWMVLTVLEKSKNMTWTEVLSLSMGWDPLEAGLLPGKPSWDSARPPTEVQGRASAGPPTEEQEQT